MRQCNFFLVSVKTVNKSQMNASTHIKYMHFICSYIFADVFRYTLAYSFTEVETVANTHTHTYTYTNA